MEMTPHRRALIDAHVADTRRVMLDCAFELNDLVRFAISAAREKPQKVYYPMDPVNESIRSLATLQKKLAQVAAALAREGERLGRPPFEPEEPAEPEGPDTGAAPGPR